MGVNMFVVVPRGAVIEDVANKCNAYWGEGGIASKELFDWAAPFEGEGGALLSLSEALAFDDDSAPWYIVDAASWADEHGVPDAFTLAQDDTSSNWRETLKNTCDWLDNEKVLFLKCRG
jgi:hypothetical protein